MMLRKRSVILLAALWMTAGCGGSENTDSDALVIESVDGSVEGASQATQGSSEAESEEEEAAPVEPNLGAQCEVDEDCASLSGSPTCITTTLIKGLGLSDTAEVPNGYCSDFTCEASADCGPEGVVCIALDEETTGVTDLFDICMVSCEAGSSTCGEGSQCYCDADQGIYNAEGETDFCSCMPEAIITLLTE